MLNNDITSAVVWRPVVGYEGLYEVSNNGLVRSLDRVVIERRTKRAINRKGKLLKQNISDGYYVVGLGKAGLIKTLRVHRLVAMAFVPGYTKKKRVTNHKNGKKLDNSVDNLEWCTVSQNLTHAYALGLKPRERGSKHYATKLNERKVRSIKRLAKDGARNKDIAKAHGTSAGIVSAIRTGKSWRHVIA